MSSNLATLEARKRSNDQSVYTGEAGMGGRYGEGQVWGEAGMAQEHRSFNF